MLRRLINLFWWAFVADGMASLLREAGLLGGVAWMGHFFPLLALMLSLPAAAAVVITPRTPKRIVVPMILFLWWTGFCAAFPLMLLDGLPWAGLWLSAAEVVMGLAVWLSFRTPAAPWYWPFEEKNRDFFQWRHFLIAGASSALVVGVVIVLFVGSTTALGLAQASGGYVRLRPDGLYMIERQFKSGNNEVRLVGMVHVAQKDFYSEILPRPDPAHPAVVLVEGVTDQKNLLGKTRLGYARMAKWLGISSQEESKFTDEVRKGLTEKEPGTLSFRHSDVDVETFHPKTLAFITALMAMINADDWRQAWKMMSDPASPLNDTAASEHVMEDILHARNENLVKEIDSSLKDYRMVIVAWGAMHMPEIEEWLRKNHFEQSGQIERKALGFW